MNITIAGGTGFIGSHLLERLKHLHEIKVLTRSKKESENNIIFEQTDLFSLGSTKKGLANTDIAIYLVHSMVPATGFFQGNFQDTDLILIDNFVKACKVNNVKKILYVGGIIPEGKISHHLKSRKEVEDVILYSEIPSTILRAGMVVGDGGSSFEILKNLCSNLPAMILPQWTKRKTKIVYIDDLISIMISEVILNESKILNLVTPEDINYKDLIKQTLRHFGKQIPILSIPIDYLTLSKRWVAYFGNASLSLVSPLVDSLTSDFEKVEPSPEIANLLRYKSYESMLEHISKKPLNTNNKKPSKIRKKNVRSIQRLLTNSPCSIDEVAINYFKWLPRGSKFLVKIEKHDDRLKFKTTLFSFILLELKLTPCPPSEKRVKFYIIGGLLTKTTDTGWLEFRSVQQGKYILASINEYYPALPWQIYQFTQAYVHKKVMFAFAKFLKSKV